MGELSNVLRSTSRHARCSKKKTCKFLINIQFLNFDRIVKQYSQGKPLKIAYKVSSTQTHFTWRSSLNYTEGYIDLYAHNILITFLRIIRFSCGLTFCSCFDLD